jgi:hypothetical protein
MEVAADIRIAVKVAAHVMAKSSAVVAHAQKREQKLAHKNRAAGNRRNEKYGGHTDWLQKKTCPAEMLARFIVTAVNRHCEAAGAARI